MVADLEGQLLDLVLQSVGPIRTSLKRDRAMVEALFKVKSGKVKAETESVAALPK